MNDWNKLILGEEDSQTAPVCNGTVREMIAEIDRLKGELEDTIKYCKPYGGKTRSCTGMQAHKDLERQLDASQALRALAEARAEVERLNAAINKARNISNCKPYGGKTRSCTGMQAHKDLERQLDASQALRALAEARAEVERLNAAINKARNISNWRGEG